MRSAPGANLPAVLRPARRVDAPAQVLLVSPPVSPPWINASAILARDLAVMGQAYRYRVLGTRDQASPGGAARVEPLYSDAAPGAFGTTRVDQLRLAARLVRPDACAVHHFIFTPSARSARVARLALRVSRKRSVQTIPSQPTLTAALPELVFASRVVAVSDATALLLRSAGVPDVRVIRPSVALPPAPPTRAEARAHLGGPFVGAAADAPTFLYAGDLEHSDGATVFVDAASRVRQQHPDARFIVACRPKTAAHAHALAILRRRAAAAGLEDHLAFLGQVPDIGTLLSAVDAVVMTPDTLYAKLDLPLVLLEAMARARPLVVSDLPALGELAGLGQGTCVVRRSDPDALAAALAPLAADPALADRLGRAARQTAAACFAPERMVLAYEALYDELLDGR